MAKVRTINQFVEDTIDKPRGGINVADINERFRPQEEAHEAGLGDITRATTETVNTIASTVEFGLPTIGDPSLDDIRSAEKFNLNEKLVNDGIASKDILHEALQRGISNESDYQEFKRGIQDQRENQRIMEANPISSFVLGIPAAMFDPVNWVGGAGVALKANKIKNIAKLTAAGGASGAATEGFAQSVISSQQATQDETDVMAAALTGGLLGSAVGGAVGIYKGIQKDTADTVKKAVNDSLNGDFDMPKESFGDFQEPGKTTMVDLGDGREVPFTIGKDVDESLVRQRVSELRKDPNQTRSGIEQVLQDEFAPTPGSSVRDFDTHYFDMSRDNTVPITLRNDQNPQDVRARIDELDNGKRDPNFIRRLVQSEFRPEVNKSNAPQAIDFNVRDKIRANNEQLNVGKNPVEGDFDFNVIKNKPTEFIKRGLTLGFNPNSKYIRAIRPIIGQKFKLENSNSPFVRNMAANIFDFASITQGNRQGKKSPISLARQKAVKSGESRELVRKYQEAFAKYTQSRVPTQAGKALSNTVQRKFSSDEVNRLSFQQFNEEVWWDVVTGRPSDIPEVREMAEMINDVKTNLFNEAKKRGIIKIEPSSGRTAVGHQSRNYDKLTVRRDRGRLEAMIDEALPQEANYLSDKHTELSDQNEANQKTLDSTQGKIDDINAELNDTESLRSRIIEGNDEAKSLNDEIELIDSYLDNAKIQGSTIEDIERNAELIRDAFGFRNNPNAAQAKNIIRQIRSLDDFLSEAHRKQEINKGSDLPSEFFELDEKLVSDLLDPDGKADLRSIIGEETFDDISSRFRDQRRRLSNAQGASGDIRQLKKSSTQSIKNIAPDLVKQLASLKSKKGQRIKSGASKLEIKRLNERITAVKRDILNRVDSELNNARQEIENIRAELRQKAFDEVTDKDIQQIRQEKNKQLKKIGENLKEELKSQKRTLRQMKKPKRTELNEFIKREKENLIGKRKSLNAQKRELQTQIESTNNYLKSIEDTLRKIRNKPEEYKKGIIDAILGDYIGRTQNIPLSEIGRDTGMSSYNIGRTNPVSDELLAKAGFLKMDPITDLAKYKDDLDSAILAHDWLEDLGYNSFKDLNDDMRQSFNDQMGKAAQNLRDGKISERQYKNVIDLIESERDFMTGKPGHTEETELERDFNLALGRTGVDKGPASKALKYLRQVTAMAFLGGVTISSLPDAGMHIFKNGIGPTFKHGLTPMFRGIKGWEATGKQKEQLRSLGANIDLATSEIIRLMHGAEADQWYNRTKVDNLMDGALNLFGKVSLMEYWTTFNKNIAARVISSEIYDKAGKFKDTGEIGDIDRERFASLGMGERDLQNIAKAFERYGEDIKGTKIVDYEKWAADPELAASFERFRNGVAKEVDATIITPDKGDIPAIAQTNPLAKTLFQFKSFMTAAIDKILLNGASRRMSDRNKWMGITALLTLGTVSGAIKDTLNGNADDLPDSTEGWMEYMATEGLARSGVGTIFGDSVMAFSNGLGFTDSGRYATKNLANFLLGPSFGWLYNAAKTTAAINGEDPLSDYEIERAQQSIPFNVLSQYGRVINHAATGG